MKIYEMQQIALPKESNLPEKVSYSSCSTITEKYYDWDYKTASVEGDDVIDTTKVGMSHYENFLNPEDLDYMRKAKNEDGRIEYMTPAEYFDICARDIFRGSGVSYEDMLSSLKRSRGELDRDKIEELKSIITDDKKKFTLPFIDYVSRGQEGLHRMLALAELFGWDKKKFPVLVVDYYDKDRKRKDDIEDRIGDISICVDQALRYTYADYDEFRDELQYKIDDRLDSYSDLYRKYHRGNIPFKFDIGDSEISVTVDFEIDGETIPVTYKFDKNEIKIDDGTGRVEEDDDFDYEPYLDDAIIDELINEIG